MFDIHICRKSLKWLDNSISYFANVSFKGARESFSSLTGFLNLYKSTCYGIMLNEPGRFYPYPCNYELNTFFNWKFCTSFFCETTLYKSKPNYHIKVKSFPKPDMPRLSKQLDSAIVQCGNEEWTKTVLTCDSAGPCETKTPLNLCKLFV